MNDNESTIHFIVPRKTKAAYIRASTKAGKKLVPWIMENLEKSMDGQKYLNHITISTKHNRRSPRVEVADSTIAWLRPWLEKLLSNDVPLPLPETSLSSYSARAHLLHGCLLMTVHAPSLAPLVTFAVCPLNAETQGVQLGSMLGAKDDFEWPSAPWLAVSIEAGAKDDVGALTWLGDFERCIAWTWLESINDAG